jgi:hypothetical protein
MNTTMKWTILSSFLLAAAFLTLIGPLLQENQPENQIRLQTQDDIANYLMERGRCSGDFREISSNWDGDPNLWKVICRPPDSEIYFEIILNSHGQHPFGISE